MWRTGSVQFTWCSPSMESFCLCWVLQLWSSTAWLSSFLQGECLFNHNHLTVTFTHWSLINLIHRWIHIWHLHTSIWSPLIPCPFNFVYTRHVSKFSVDKPLILKSILFYSLKFWSNANPPDYPMTRADECDLAMPTKSHLIFIPNTQKYQTQQSLSDLVWNLPPTLCWWEWRHATSSP